MRPIALLVIFTVGCTPSPEASDDPVDVLVAAFEALDAAAGTPLMVRDSTPGIGSAVRRSNHASRIDTDAYSVFEVPPSLFAAVDSASLDDPTKIPDAFFDRSGATAYLGEDSGQVYIEGNHFMRASDSTRVQIVSLDLPVIRGDLALVEWGKRYDNFLSYDSGFISLRRGPAGWEVIARGITFST